MYCVSYDVIYDILPDGEIIYVSDSRCFVTLDDARVVADALIASGRNADIFERPSEYPDVPF